MDKPSLLIWQSDVFELHWTALLNNTLNLGVIWMHVKWG